MSVRVAVLDSGIDEMYYETHKNIFDKMVTIKQINKGHYSVVDEFPNDYHGHGTMCVDSIHVFNKDCRFLVVKLLNNDCRATTQALVAGLEFLLNQNVQIVHMSIAVTKENDSSEDIMALCAALREQGKIIVCSVENGKTTSFPANLQSVVGVVGGVFQCYNGLNCDFERQIQFVCDATPSLVSTIKGRRDLFSGNSKAACVATAAIAEVIGAHNINNIQDSYIQKWILNRQITSFRIIRHGYFPQIQKNRVIDFNAYSWDAYKVLDEFCDIFSCTKERILRERLVYACDNLSGNAFIQMFSRIEKRENAKICFSDFHYSNFEWLWCLFDFIEKEIKKGRPVYEV